MGNWQIDRNSVLYTERLAWKVAILSNKIAKYFLSNLEACKDLQPAAVVSP